MITWPYVAGFFDGEGSISPDKGGFKISIAQSHFMVFSRIKDFLGEHGITAKIYPNNGAGKTKDHWHLQISKRDHVFAFLSNVFPHLVVKRNLAEDVIRYGKLFPQPMTYRLRVLARHAA